MILSYTVIHSQSKSVFTLYWEITKAWIFDSATAKYSYGILLEQGTTFPFLLYIVDREKI